MTRALRFLCVLTLAALSAFALAQPKQQSSWTAHALDATVRAGESTQVVFEGTITKDWYVYGPQIKGYWQSTVASLADDNKAPVKVVADPSTGENIWPVGYKYKVPSADGEGKTDAVVYKHAVAFGLPIQIAEDAKPGETTIKVTITSQACSTVNGTCDIPRPHTLEVPLTIEAGTARPDHVTPVVSAPTQPEGYELPPADEQYTGEATTPEAAPDTTNPSAQDSGPKLPSESQGIFAFFIVSMGAGLLALLTPCVWPMIPVTVSYFSKQGDDKAANLKAALAYGLGIIFTFVGLGLGAAIIFKSAGGPQVFAANVWVNLFLGLLFIVLAMNLFGYYEILIPTKFVNKVQGKAKSGGWIAPVLLGFVFSLTSFTCTVPFVGSVLVGATTGNYLFPIVGMLGFSLAFAVPFFLLALAPQAVSKLPKSGTWMNTIKGFLGFVELAAALKFLSNAELTFQFGFLTYPVYMAVWVAIFAVSALYLFGLIKIPNDEGGIVGNGRRIGGFAMVAFSGYLLACINTPTLLGSGVAFAPPTVYPGTHVATVDGLSWTDTYKEVLAKAKEENKPVFLNFTGVTCSNCRVMEARFRNNAEYIKRLKPFVLGELYTDRNTPDDNEHAKIREDLTKSAANPTYVILKPDGTFVSFYPGLAQSDQDFFKFLEDGYKNAGGTESSS